MSVKECLHDTETFPGHYSDFYFFALLGYFDVHELGKYHINVLNSALARLHIPVSQYCYCKYFPHYHMHYTKDLDMTGVGERMVYWAHSFHRYRASRLNKSSLLFAPPLYLHRAGISLCTMNIIDYLRRGIVFSNYTHIGQVKCYDVMDWVHY